VRGVYRVEGLVKYSSGNTAQISQPHFLEVFGNNFRVLNFISTINIPNENNMILVEMIPPQTIGASVT
jgi:hypothetical protein